MIGKSLLVALAGSLCIATAAIAAPLVQSGAVGASAKRFVKQALQGDNSEIALGQLAAQRATRPDVKSYGQLLADNHAAAKQKALGVASQIQVRPTSAMSHDGKREMRKLERLSGPAFDREFISYMVRDHQRDIAKFDREAKRHDGAVSALARDSIPTLQKHLAIARGLSGTKSSQR